MNFFLFVLAGVAVTGVVRWSIQVRRRNAQTWDSLAARLHPGWDAPIHQSTEDSSLEEHWRSVRGARGLWLMYQNAKAMQDMVSFAVRHKSALDPVLLAELRSDAMQIRMLVLATLGQYAVHQLNEEICGKAGRAASTYDAMSQRMSFVLEAGNPQMHLVGSH